MIGRADIEGSKRNVPMNAWAAAQASYRCGLLDKLSRAGRVGTRTQLTFTGRIKKQRRYERLAALWIIFETLNLKTQLSCVNLIVTNIFKNLQHSCYDIWIEYDHSCKMRLWKLKKAKLVFCRDRLQQVSERKKIT